ncbi:hypothetical protein BGZ51_005755 [Haplosporangium sp. Z 767]|nr:hypothetical protein BGZ51_005755 [Haplosporangium sp. Z 767]
MDPHAAPVEDGAGSGAELRSSAVWAAGVFAFSSTLISLVAIWMQLKNYRKPLLQRSVVRILWMVPIFAISSWISLVSLDIAFYVDAFRDIYEAFVIYCFFSLLVCYLGGERSLLVMLHGRPYTKHLWPVSLWSKEMDVGDPYTFLFIKRGILQYVYVKPVLAAVTMLLKSNGAYNDGSISLKSGYFWVSFVYNLSVCLSLYCLGMFFMATQDDLEEFRYAFSHKDYTELDIYSARMPIYFAVRDAIGIKDIIQDSLETLKGTRFTYRTFEPSEGVATDGMSRSGRIMAGLRYTGGGTSKYWLPDANKIGRDGLGNHDGTLPSSAIPGQQYHQQQQYGGRPDYTRDPNSYSQQALGASYPERAPSLYFADVDEQDEDGMEELYSASKQLKFGDYNFPAIDVFDPHRSKESDRRKMARKNKKKARMYGETTVASSLLGDGGGASEETRPLMSEAITFGKSGWDQSPAVAKSRTTEHGHGHGQGVRDKEPEGKRGSTAPRDGCVDNVNGYVPDSKSKKKKGLHHPAAPSSSRSTEGGWSQHNQQRQQMSNNNNSNNVGGIYDTYGYGYQSYQQPSSSANYMNQGHQHQVDDEEHRGPMFFFL